MKAGPARHPGGRVVAPGDYAGAPGVGAPSAAQVASFGEFCSTLVKEMIFLLDDALGRLTDVKSRQDEMADVAVWNAQPYDDVAIYTGSATIVEILAGIECAFESLPHAVVQIRAFYIKGGDWVNILSMGYLSKNAICLSSS